MLAAPLRLGDALVNSEMPVHVCCFLAFSFFVGAETTTALGARGSEVFVNQGQEVGPEKLEGVVG
jgi:hypothetical protein